MPKIVKHQPGWFALRFCIPLDENDELVHAFYDFHSDNYCIAKEHGSKTGQQHYQGAILVSMSCHQLSAVIKQHLDLSGNKQFSCKPIRSLSDYFEYLKKESLWIDQLSVDVSPARPRKAVKDFFERFIESFAADRQLDLTGAIAKFQLTRQYLFDYTMEYFEKHSRVHDEVIIKRFYFALIARYNPSEHAKSFKTLRSQIIDM